MESRTWKCLALWSGTCILLHFEFDHLTPAIINGQFGSADSAGLGRRIVDI